MYKPTKLTLATVAAIVAASAPSTASAFIPSDSGGGPAASTVSVRALENATSPASGTESTASSSGFQWGDAGIGAAGTLLLIGVSSCAGAARRRRTGPLAG
jgi:hypothetical protein